MKRVRSNYPLVSSALGLILALSSHPGLAQQVDKIDSAVPMPDTTFPPPPTANDVAAPTPARAAESAQSNAAGAAPDAAEPATLAQDKPQDSSQNKSQDKYPPAAPVEMKQQAGATRAGGAASVEPAKPMPATASNPIADKMREIITGDALKRLIGREADRAGVEAFYKSRDYAPMWVENGRSSARANSAIAYLGRASEAGLDPADYPVPEFKSDAAPEALAEAEIRLTNSALTFARHAQMGRIHFSRVAADISFNQLAPDPAEVLGKLAASEDAEAVLDRFNPPQREFKALRAKLAELRKQKEQEPEKERAPVVHIAEGKTLRLGMKDPRVLALRQRLDIPGDKNNPLYDEKVREAVDAFQLSVGMDGNGVLGPSTVHALNGGEQTARPTRNSVIDTVIVNMERWRWVPRELGNPHVIVNVPDYMLTLWNDDQVYWASKIVAGKPGKATPMVSAQMTHITVNPTWNVPPSIIEKEYLPALQQDPEALDRIGLKVRQDADGTVHISQPPGARNALGRIRFNFPNKFLVYQHDTPDKNLFDKEKRAYSHGCMRVQNPLVYGEKLLSLAMPEGHYTEARLKRMFGDNESNINFDKPIWVHLTYQTAFVDQDGNLQLRDDVYRRDARMLAILKGTERKVADIAIPRGPDSSSRPVRLPPGSIDRYGGSEGGGGNFMDWLFGGGPQYDRPRRSGFFDGPRVINGRYSAR